MRHGTYISHILFSGVFFLAASRRMTGGLNREGSTVGVDDFLYRAAVVCFDSGIEYYGCGHKYRCMFL